MQQLPEEEKKNVNIQISPSIAAGNLLRLEEEVRKIEAAGADMIHVDVMDGHFVPLLTIGVPIVEQLRGCTKKHLDVHLMIANPDQVFQDYLDAGADTLTFHIESALHAHRICQKIRDFGKCAGIALNPATHWQSVQYLLHALDQITVMTVDPGFSRQMHIFAMHPKIFALAEYCREHQHKIGIQVDGGVSPGNVPALVQCGATNLVAGGSIMGQEDYGLAVRTLRQKALEGTKPLSSQ